MFTDCARRLCRRALAFQVGIEKPDHLPTRAGAVRLTPAVARSLDDHQFVLNSGLAKLLMQGYGQ
jgi:hypothetical protein